MSAGAATVPLVDRSGASVVVHEVDRGFYEQRVKNDFAWSEKRGRWEHKDALVYHDRFGL